MLRPWCARASGYLLAHSGFCSDWFLRRLNVSQASKGLDQCEGQRNRSAYEARPEAEPTSQAKLKTLRGALPLSAGSFLPEHCWEDGKDVLGGALSVVTYVV